MKRPLRIAIVTLLVAAVGAGVAALSFPRETLAERKPVRIGHPAGGRVEKTDAEWKAELSPPAYHITRDRGTERACSAEGWNSKAEGRYDCVCCGQPLFDSGAKFESGTGWPSFLKPVDPEAVSLFEDRGFGVRIEVTCSRCDAHLGHVFDDGPPPAGKRFCMNMGAMRFVPR